MQHAAPRGAAQSRDNFLPSVAASTTNLPTNLTNILTYYQTTINLPTNWFELRKITTSNNIYTTKSLIVGMFDFLYLEIVCTYPPTNKPFQKSPIDVILRISLISVELSLILSQQSKSGLGHQCNGISTIMKIHFKFQNFTMKFSGFHYEIFGISLCNFRNFTI